MINVFKAKPVRANLREKETERRRERQIETDRQRETERGRERQRETKMTETMIDQEHEHNSSSPKLFVDEAEQTEAKAVIATSSLGQVASYGTSALCQCDRKRTATRRLMTRMDLQFTLTTAVLPVPPRSPCFAPLDTIGSQFYFSCVTAFLSLLRREGKRYHAIITFFSLLSVFLLDRCGTTGLQHSQHRTNRNKNN